MEEKTTQQLIEERFKQLPKIVQKTIKDSDWLSNLRKIISENNLLIDQGLVVETETFLMMLGLENPKNYTKNIKKEANLSKEQAVQIATEVEEKILSVVKRKIIEETENKAGIEENPLEEILGKDPEIENSLPSIDTNLDDEQSEIEDRKNLINELGGDIEIEQEETEEELAEREQFEQLSQTQKEKEISTKTPSNLPTENTDKTLESNKIPIIDDTDPNPRFIDTNLSKHPDNLPTLEPVRTLETDSENRDDIITTKLAGAEIKKPEIKTEEETEKIPEKPKGPDPYRESFE